LVKPEAWRFPEQMPIAAELARMLAEKLWGRQMNLRLRRWLRVP
jgi:hypothetical protein